MTRIERSESQLNAEAAASLDDLNPREALAVWHIAYERETPDRLASSYPPEMTEHVDGVAMRRIDPGSGVGVTMSAALAHYLDGSGGRMFLVHDALRAWDRHCRRAHSRRPDHRGRPICADMVWALVRDGTTLEWASAQAGVSKPRAALLLVDAFRFMRQRQERWYRQIENVVTHDRDMCPKCRAEDAA